MALNFPDSPTLNQVYTDTTSGFSYQWDGTVWQSYTPSAAKNITILDDISGSFDGVTLSFPIAVDGTAFEPANAQQLRIVLGGIIQEPLADYVVSGANIAFTTPPSFGLSFSGISLGPAIPVVGVGSTANFYTRQSYTVSGTQSSFTVTGGYNIGFLDVYHNGVRLVVGVDYTATDGTGFTLTTPAQNDDIVEAISFVTSEYYTLNGLLNNLIVTGDASIGGNTYITGITTVLGSLNVIGGGNFSTAGIGTFGVLDTGNLTNSGNLNVAGVTTLGNKVKVGVGTTALIVEGDARITGILTIGTSSITFDGTNNQVSVGSGVTINSTGINIGSGVTISSSGINIGPGVLIHSGGLNVAGSQMISGMGVESAGVSIGYGITTLNFVGSGNTFAVNGSRIDISISSGGGGASSQWVTTAAGINTVSNVGVGTTNPQYKLDVAGDINLTGTFRQNGSTFVASRWTSGTGDNIYRSSGNIGLGLTNPQYKLDVAGDINFTGTFRQNGSAFVASRWTAGSGDNIYRLNGDIGIGVASPTAKLDVNGVIKDANGNVRSIPNNDKTSGYTLTANDIGELINITTGGVTVPASVFSAGNSITIYNNSGSNQNILQGSGVTLRLAGTSTTGNRTLALRGIATVMCVGSNDFVISGAGLS